MEKENPAKEIPEQAIIQFPLPPDAHAKISAWIKNGDKVEFFVDAKGLLYAINMGSRTKQDTA